jgi:Zn-dependent protease with chaperone function
MKAILVGRKDGVEIKKQVLLKVHNGSIDVCDDETGVSRFKLSSHSMSVQLGGNNDRLLFVRSPNLHGDVLYIEVTSQVRQTFLSDPILKEKMQIIFKAHQFKWLSGVSLVGFLVGLLVLLGIYRAEVFGNLAQAIPFSFEKVAADRVLNPKINEKQKVALDQLEKLTGLLKFPKDQWDHPFVFHISSDTTPNAFATFGGHIYIHKGLIVLLDKPEDLLGVIGHEMIHVQRRHVVKSAVQAIGVYTTLSLLFGDVSGLAAVLMDQGAPLLNLQYSRNLEEEADRLAVELLVTNNLDPKGLGRALTAIDSEIKKMFSQSPAKDVLEKLQKIEILNSHPLVDERVKNINVLSDKLTQDKKIKKIDFPYGDFQKLVKDTF